jgi:hypothetical protein
MFVEKQRRSGDARALSYEGKRRGDDNALTQVLGVQGRRSERWHALVQKPVTQVPITSGGWG